MAFCENVTNTFRSDIDGMQYDKTHRKIPQTLQVECKYD